MYNNDNLII